MRALLIDIGNTSMKIGLSSADAILTSYTLSTNAAHSGDSLGFQLLKIFEDAGIPFKGKNARLAACYVSSVVPNMDPLLRHACERYLNITPIFAHQDLAVPLENHYEHPMEVGADRLVAAYGARCLFPDSCSVVSVDYGTATTFDCVTNQAYLGGLICPGILSALSALSTKTAQLPQIALDTEADSPIVCRNTVTSLSHGFLFGFAAMTEGLCKHLREILKGDVAFVATGGFAPAIARVTSCFNLVRQDLILEGLRLLWQSRI